MALAKIDEAGKVASQPRIARNPSVTRCEVCDKTGAAARDCRFEKACSCWYGVPCHNGESIRQQSK